MRIVPPTGPAGAAPSATARHLPPPVRRRLALDALAGQPVADLAAAHRVSRKFVYQQRRRAHGALDQAFAPAPAAPAQLLFWLPVTKPWLRQLVLGLTLICHSSQRGVQELLADLFDHPLSLGAIHNILAQAVPPARQHNAAQDLGGVRLGAHDEIFQGQRPVLVGVDTDSTFCYLLSLEEHRDADTWGVRLLELAERGWAPEATVADFGLGLRAGQAQALPGVPCQGDVFHAQQDAPALVRYLENRAYEALAKCGALEQRQARHEWQQGRKNAGLGGQLGHARAAAARAVALADDVATLLDWLRHDVLALAGPAYAVRGELYDWIVAELQAREAQQPRLRPLRTLLQNQRDVLLEFARQLEQDLRAVATAQAVPPALVEEVRQVLGLPARQPQRWQREQVLWQQLGQRYVALRAAVAGVLARVVRASSVVENLNGRLRGYFFLRRHLGSDYLALLQFFLNHRRLLRSERPERVGKSPAELLTGQKHPHWLALLGYTPFSRN